METPFLTCIYDLTLLDPKTGKVCRDQVGEGGQITRLDTGMYLVFFEDGCAPHVHENARLNFHFDPPARDPEGRELHLSIVISPKVALLHFYAKHGADLSINLAHGAFDMSQPQGISQCALAVRRFITSNDCHMFDPMGIRVNAFTAVDFLH